MQVYGAPAQKGADYYAWLVLAELVGDFADRLNMNLRQDKGYSYGYFALPLRLAGGMAFLSGGGVQTDKTKESVVELAKENRALTTDRPIDAKEVEEARLGLVRNYAAGFGTHVDVAGRVADLWSRRWPLAELEREPTGLGRVPLADVQAAAKRYVVPADTSLLLIGDRAKIEAGVRALKLGDVVLIDVEGRPIGGK